MTESAGRRFAWAVFAVVVLLLGGTMLASLSGVRAAGDNTQPVPATGAEVVVVGAPGLSWSDISQAATPTLWSLVGEGASAGLIVRGTHELTCPADGWLTLGAGQRASADDDGLQDCAAVPEVVLEQGSDAAGAAARIPQWSTWAEAAQRRPLDAHLGSLGEAAQSAGECVRAIGPLAALGAADAQGQVDRYAERSPGGYQPGACAITLLDAGAVTGPTDAAALDAQVAELRSQIPPEATLLVAGLADRGERAGVRAVLLWQPEGTAGALHSTTTSQTRLVQTTDLTATVLELAGIPVPEAVSGAPVRVQPEDRSAAQAVGALQDLSAGIDQAKALAYPVLGVGCGVLLVGLLAGARSRRRRTVRFLGLAAMAFPSAAFLAGLVPWWRGSPAWLLLALVLLVLIGLQVALAVAGPWRHHPLGPPVVIAGLTVLVLGMDVILGAPLALISILGAQPLTAGRFYGMGNVGYGIFAVSGLLLAGLLAGLLRSRPHSRRMAAALVVGVLGLLLVLVDGAPTWGADFGGVPALVVALGVLGCAAAEIRLTALRIVLIGVGAALVAGALMVLDWLRPPEDRTHLGAFWQSVLDGEAAGVIARKLDQSLGLLVRYPVSWVAVLVLVLVVWAVASPGSRPGRWLTPLWQFPMVRATATAVLICLVLGWALNDSGIAVLGIGLAVAIAATVSIGATMMRGTAVPRSTVGGWLRTGG